MSAGLRARRVRGVLVATQYAVAIVLLTGAGLLIRSFLLLNLMDRGFDSTPLLTVSVPLPYEKYEEPARGQAFFEEAIQRLDSLPGVQGAATGSAVFDTFQGNVPNENIVVEGKLLTQDPINHERNIVSENYFQLIGIALQEGRSFPTRTPGANRLSQSSIEPWLVTSGRRRMLSGSGSKRFFQVWTGIGSLWLALSEMSYTAATGSICPCSIVRNDNGISRSGK